jgi:uncharacterized protein YkwD
MIRLLVALSIISLINNVIVCQADLYSFTQKNYRESEVFNHRIDPADPNVKILNAVVFYVTNEKRLEEGLPSLNYHYLLEESAQLHSENMAKQGFFDHINPKSRKYKTPEDRAKSVGIKNPFIAENIIENFVLDYQSGLAVYTDGKGKFWYKNEDDPIKPHTYLSLADKLLDEWMNSQGHRKNILSKDAMELGCGVAFFKKDNGMPSLMGTQNFQLFEPLK